MDNKYNQFVKEAAEVLPKSRIFTDPLTTFAYGTDASFYRLIPQAVIRVNNQAEVAGVVRLANQHRVPITFRAAGTSLSGQAVTDSVLVQLDGNWSDIRIGNKAKTISLQPGVIGGRANRALAPYFRKIGPDPASINAAMIGGIAANNASGMCCGTAENSYQTVQSMKIVLADGTALDTADSASVDAFRQSHKPLLDGLADLAEEIADNKSLKDKILRKYRIKNTCGYSLNAFVDYKDPIDILQHLMIGSEGTLGFIAEITYRTIADPPHKACALVIFPDARSACQAVPELKESPATAVELIDNAGLKAIAGKRGMPDFIAALPKNSAALLVDTRDIDEQSLTANITTISRVLANYKTIRPVEFTSDASRYAQIWAVRKGLFPAVGAVRDIGTTVVIEDIAFPVQYLADGVEALQEIFDRYDYQDAIVFGHAMDGNLHIVFSQTFETEKQTERYSEMLSAMVDMVVERFDGSLKAEHGTGRNMAPFVEREWGEEAWQIMWRLKALFDPNGILNPDVILTKNRRLHLENLKPVPAAHDSIDKCIECGFCESVCPSLELTLTPRQRITVWREIQRLQSMNTPTAQSAERLRSLRKDYNYQGEETCAACGMCQLNCPVDINTGDLIRAYRSDRNGQPGWLARQSGEHFAAATRIARGALKLAQFGHRLLGNSVMSAATGVLYGVSGGKIPHWSVALPKAAKGGLPKTNSTKNQPLIIYFPCCTARMMGPAIGDTEERSLAQVVTTVLERAGYQVLIPENADQLCCGMPWKSKGYPQVAQQKAQELTTALGKYPAETPILLDTSPCVHTMNELQSKIYCVDPAKFIEEHLLDKLSISIVKQPVMLHAPCSSRRAGYAETLKRITNTCASSVVEPADIACCGFAGDRGFSTPELTASALARLKQQVPKECQMGISSSRTCEIGLSQHSGIYYKSIFYLLEDVSR